MMEPVRGLARITRDGRVPYEPFHDLVAANVSPASGSRWAASVREFDDVEDPRPYIDLVLEDEFPVSIFYSALKTKLA